MYQQIYSKTSVRQETVMKSHLNGVTTLTTNTKLTKHGYTSSKIAKIEFSYYTHLYDTVDMHVVTILIKFKDLLYIYALFKISLRDKTYGLISYLVWSLYCMQIN